ncbi:hypothetical protein ABZ297_04960 [Nonomuraea sp. NPDC005983]|uniref:hypothetical protein n=1 Tax=Nonomuraea sp. NPDC005983 TaxID=3155595 RepID=UPI0033B217D3
MSTLKVLEVRSGDVLGTFTQEPDGRLEFSSAEIRSMVETMATARGWTSQETFDELRGWSNGYVQIMPALTLAKVFDGVRDGEPYFLPDHPRDDDPRLAAYLKAGTPILSTTGTNVDFLDPARGEVVPLTFRTDGTWIWTDTITYYLEKHRIRPDEGLCAHIAAQGYRCPRVDEATARHAIEELRRG